MSILNVLLRPDQLLITVDTLAEDALTGSTSSGAKLLLIPQHNLVLATRGSTQFFLRIYELCLQASFRADFTMEQLIRELGLVIDQIWPTYERAAVESGLSKSMLHTELVLGGWSPKYKCFMATTYAKSDIGRRTEVLPLVGGMASPGEPLADRKDSFDPADLLVAGRLQAAWLDGRVGGTVAGGHLLMASLTLSSSIILDLGAI